MRKTAAWPLALVYLVLIGYASLFPFAHWRDQGVSSLQFLWAPLPKYWTGFDVGVNVVGYIPLGFLTTWAALKRTNGWLALMAGVLVAAITSLVMEATQSFLPGRVPSNLDWLLNTAGGLAGALLVFVVRRLGLLAFWGDLKNSWFVGEPRGVLVLLALWPVALIYPTALPFGLGQVAERVVVTWEKWWEGTDYQYWLSSDAGYGQPLSPLTEWACVLFGLLIPSLLAYSVMTDRFRRWLLMFGVVGAGLTMAVASSVLTFGPEHAWVWVTRPAQAAVIAAVVFASLLIMAPRRVCLVLTLGLLILQLTWINHAPTSSYFLQNLGTWEQGRFARFNGLAQWLGWLWPYAVALYAGFRLSRPESAQQRATNGA
jgi:VanZ family protein